MLLRPLALQDADCVYSCTSDIENTRYMMWLPRNTINHTRQFLAAVTDEWRKNTPTFFEFAVLLDRQLIGCVSAYLTEGGTACELGWMIDRQWTGKGYGSEVAAALKNFAINELKVKKLTAHCDFRNTASCRLMEKIGLTLVDDSGTRTYPKRGETVKELHYSLIVG